MLRHLTSALLATLTCMALAAETLYAPGLHPGQDVTSNLGFINPQTSQEVITVTGYDETGQSLGSLSMTLPAHGRIELAATNLIAQTTPAWCSIESERRVIGYIRQTRSSDQAHALFPMTAHRGQHIPLPTLKEDGSDTTLSIINASPQEGQATLSPVRSYPYWFNYAHLEEPARVEAFGAPYQSKTFNYDTVISEGREGIQWDALESNLPLIGVQHFNGPNNFDALLSDTIAPRTLSLIPPADKDIESQLVLLNTTEEILLATLTIHDKYFEPTQVDIALDPSEKQTFTFGDRGSVPQFMPAWWSLQSNGTGLSAYIKHQGNNGRNLAVSAATQQVGSALVIPYLEDDMDISIINNSELSGSIHIWGMNDSGQSVAYYFLHPLKAHELKQVDLKDLFGNDADDVTWIRMRGQRSQISASAFFREGKGDIATLNAIPVDFRWDHRQIANFEFNHALELDPQGWQPILFDNDQLTWANTYPFHDGLDDPRASSFFLERHMAAASGKAGLGYEPVTDVNYSDETVIQSVGLTSPLFEVPHYSAGYLSYDIRWINPEFSNPNDRFGLAWRVEGGDWHWFGARGSHLLRTRGVLQDCWERICYRNNHTEVTITPWFKMQMPLPQEALGKRIQVALFYEREHIESNHRTGPILFIDNIAVQTSMIPHSIFFEDTAESVVAQAEEDDENAPEEGE